MQFLALVLLALVSFAQAAAVAERGRSLHHHLHLLPKQMTRNSGVNPSLKVASTFCKDTATLVSTKKIQGVRVKQFACNDTTKAAPSPAVNTNTTSLEARQFDACTSTTPGVCQSSVLCKSSVGFSTGSIERVYFDYATAISVVEFRLTPQSRRTVITSIWWLPAKTVSTLHPHRCGKADAHKQKLQLELFSRLMIITTS